MYASDVLGELIAAIDQGKLGEPVEKQILLARLREVWRMMLDDQWRRDLNWAPEDTKDEGLHPWPALSGLKPVEGWGS